jgi:hypothetical protein
MRKAPPRLDVWATDGRDRARSVTVTALLLAAAAAPSLRRSRRVTVEVSMGASLPVFESRASKDFRSTADDILTPLMCQGEGHLDEPVVSQLVHLLLRSDSTFAASTRPRPERVPAAGLRAALPRLEVMLERRGRHPRERGSMLSSNRG